MPSNRLPDGTLVVVVSHDAKRYLSATGVADTLQQAPLGDKAIAPQLNRCSLRSRSETNFAVEASSRFVAAARRDCKPGDRADRVRWGDAFVPRRKSRTAARLSLPWRQKNARRQ
jgi:hypothetical protein